MGAELHHWPLTIAHPNLGPGWAPMYQRPGTDDAAIADEIVIHDVYQLRGFDLTAVPLGPDDGGPAGGSKRRVVLDIGANVGFFAMTCERMGARVVAVEPNADNFAMLQANASRHVTPMLAAVGATTGTTRIGGTTGTASTIELRDICIHCGRDWNVCSADMCSTRTIEDIHTRGPRRMPPRDGVEVQQVTLASLIEPHARVAILKVDTEGSEADILLNCPHELLARCDRIVAELHGPPGSPWADPTDWGRIVQHLLETHNCQVFGRPSEGGGHLFANRYDR